MKNKKIAVYLGTALLLLTLTSCKNPDVGTDAQVVERNNVDTTIDEDGKIDSSSQQSKAENNHSRKDNGKINNDNQQNSEDVNKDAKQSGEEINNDKQQGDEEENINSQQSTEEENPDNSQSDKEENANSSQGTFDLEGNVESIGNGSVVINQVFHPSPNEAVSYEGADKVLITVNFSESTKFEVWTVRNSGVNGDADIDKQEGTFSDIKEEASIKLTGNYEGNDFYAERVIIYKFV